MERFTADKSDHPDCIIKPRVFGKPMGFAYESIRDFIECLEKGEKVKVGLDDGLKVSQVILAILQSAEERTPIVVDYT